MRQPTILLHYSNPYRKLESFFLTKAYAQSDDPLDKANISLIFIVNLLGFIIILPIFIWVITMESFKPERFYPIIACVIFFSISLYLVRENRYILGVAHSLIAFSFFQFILNLCIYKNTYLGPGLHLASILMMSNYLFPKRQALIWFTLHMLAVIGFIFISSFEIAPLPFEPLERSTGEEIFITGMLLTICWALIIHYRKVQDATAKKLEKSLEELKASQAATEELSDLKSRFLANMSHEIRTPLNGILGIAELLKENVENDEKNELLQIMERSGFRLLNTIEGILSLSKIESGDTKFEPTLINVNDCVKEVTESQQALLMERHLQLEFDAENTSLMVNVNEQMMFQVLQNILSNAIKFSPPNSLIHITSRADDNFAIIDITDQGIGISEEFQSRIFEPFERALLNEKEFPGTGLGLSISNKFIQLMGGKIHLQSKQNEGSTFTVKLPLKSVE